MLLRDAVLDINESILWYNEQQQELGKRFWKAIKNELTSIKKIR